MKKVIILALLSLNAFAHPHVFIDASSKVVVANSKEVQIEIEWLFDGLTSESLLMEFDMNGNGKIDKKEQARAKANFKNNISQYDYMTELYLGDKKKKSKFTHSKSSFSTRPIVFEGKKFSALVYKYTIKAKVKNVTDKLRFKLAFYDPTSYSEIATAKKMGNTKGIKLLASKLDKMKSMHDVTVGL